MNEIRHKLIEMMDSVQNCPLKNAGAKVVYPTGDIGCNLMLIGEAPGAQEEKLGQPFIGASGKFLNEFLLPSINLTRENVYVTNIVKVRPPNNRDPLPAEIQAWAPILCAEIELVQPKVIACLGRYSLRYFLPKAVIGSIHGQAQTIQIEGQRVILMPLYHPAAALYNGSLRPILLQDFKKIQQFL